MPGPILATAAWVSDAQYAAALEFAQVISGNAFACKGITWAEERFTCCNRAFYFAPVATIGGPEHDVPACPVCQPWAYLNDQTSAHRARLVKALADTDAVHVLLVALDGAQHKGRTDVSRLRNPDDVLRIEQLEQAKQLMVLVRGRHAGVGSMAAVHAWARAPERLLNELDDQAGSRQPVIYVGRTDPEQTRAAPPPRVDEVREVVVREVAMRGHLVSHSSNGRWGRNVAWVESGCQFDEAMRSAIAACMREPTRR